MNAAVARLAAERLVKECATCGAVFTLAEWGQLPYLGEQHDPVFAVELRNCECGSTLAKLTGLSEEGRRLGTEALHDEQDALLEAKNELERKGSWAAAEDVEDEILVISLRLAELDAS